MNLPDPLHPAIVHFPIVLIIVGAVFALVTLFARRKTLAVCTAAIFVAAALGAWAAVATGDDSEEAVDDNLQPHHRTLVHAHEDAADWTLWMAVASAVAASLTAVLALRSAKRPLLLAGHVATLLLALCAVGAVLTTAKRGGVLVYENGIGIKAATNVVPSAEHGHDDDE